MAKRSDRLLREIEAGALDAGVPIADLLRKVIMLGGQSGSAELRDWATRELRGYGPEDELPEYRQIAAPLAMDAATPGGFVRGQQLSPWQLPDFARDSIGTDLNMRQGIQAIERMAQVKTPGETAKLAPPGSQELVMLMNADAQWNGHIERIYWSVSPVALEGIVDQVGTALTVMVAEITANMPDGAVTPSPDIATHAINLAVSGKRHTINVTAAQGENANASTAGPVTPPEETPRRWMKIAAGVVLGLVAIAAMIFALMQVQGWRFR